MSSQFSKIKGEILSNYNSDTNQSLLLFIKKPLIECSKTIERLYLKKDEYNEKIEKEREEKIINELNTLQNKPKILKKSNIIIEKKGNYIPIHKRIYTPVKNINSDPEKKENKIENSIEIKKTNKKQNDKYHEISKKWLENKNDKINKLKSKFFENDQINCTFKPKISVKSRLISSNLNQNKSVEKRLIEKYDNQREKMNKTISTCLPSFQPILNERTKKIILRKKLKDKKINVFLTESFKTNEDWDITDSKYNESYLESFKKRDSSLDLQKNNPYQNLIKKIHSMSEDEIEIDTETEA